MAENKVNIRIVTSERGWGERGSVIDVSPDRASRWCQNGIAELVRSPPKEKEVKKPTAKEG